MKMKEAEARTGLDRKNIRYYESEELLAPRRTEGNRYRITARTIYSVCWKSVFCGSWAFPSGISADILRGG